MKDIFQSMLISVRDKLSALFDKLQKITIFNRTPGKKVIIIGFSVIILALALFSVITLIDVNSDSGEETTAAFDEIDPTVLEATNQKPIHADFFFALTDSDKTRVMSAMVFSFNSENATASYYYVPADSSVSVSGIYDSFSGHLTSGGIPQFILAATEHTGVEFDRYVVVTEASFANLLAKLGNTTVNVESRVSYSHKGVSFIIDEGTQTLTPDMLLKYFVYLMGDTKANGNKLGELIICLIEKITASEDYTELEKDFCTALGFFETNISAFDFTNNKETINAIKLMNLSERSLQVDPDAVSK